MPGYSGTSLVKKLGITPNTEVAVFNAPEEYGRFIGPMPEGVRIASEITDRASMIHVFVRTRRELADLLTLSIQKMNRGAMVWVSWPKKSSKVQTDVTEDTIRDVALPMGLVDIKVCAVDETWSALKLVIRKSKRDRAP